MFKKIPRCARPFVKKFLRKILENKLNLDGGDLAEKNSLTKVKRVAAECFFELNRHVLMKSLRVNYFREVGFDQHFSHNCFSSHRPESNFHP